MPLKELFQSARKIKYLDRIIYVLSLTEFNHYYIQLEYGIYDILAYYSYNVASKYKDARLLIYGDITNVIYAQDSNNLNYNIYYIETEIGISIDRNQTSRISIIELS